MYLYFNSNGVLLETINDEALRQYNTGVNTIHVFIENADDSESGRIAKDIVSLNYWFQLPNGDTLNKTYMASRADNFNRKTIPFDKNRDLKFFSYGKMYDFFTIEVPCDKITEATNNSESCVSFVSEKGVLNSNGNVLMTIQAVYEDEDARCLSLERVAFTVESSVMLPDAAVNTSEFNWLLNQYVFGYTGSSALVYNKKYTYWFIEDIPEVATIEFSISDFNRKPKIDDSFILVYYANNAQKTYMVIAHVEGIDTENNKATITFTTSDAMLIGDGQTLTYEKIDVINEEHNFEDDSITKTISLRTNEFNRKPVKGEHFFYLYYIEETKKTYATIARVANIDTMTVAIQNSSIRCLTGENGENALTYNGVMNITEYVPNERFEIRVSEFNRTPIKGESFIALCRVESLPYIATFVVHSVDSIVCKISYAYKYSVKGETGATGARGETGTTPNIAITATIDKYIGTPSVKVSKTGTTENPTFNFDFHNLKGETGKTGAKIVSTTLISTDNKGNHYRQTFDDGTTSEFIAPNGPVGKTPSITVNATIDDSVGTPKVNVAQSGTNESPLLTFNFQNLKGPQGVQGIQGKTGEQGVQGKQGIQGEKGENGADGADGVGIVSATVKTVTETEEYVTSTIEFQKSDNTVDRVEIKAKNGFNPNTVACTATVSSSSWYESTVYSDYGYKYSAVVLRSGDSDHIIYSLDTYVPEVIPANIADINDINFAPFASTSRDGVSIYARQKPTTTKTFNVVLYHVET